MPSSDLRSALPCLRPNGLYEWLAGNGLSGDWLADLRARLPASLSQVTWLLPAGLAIAALLVLIALVVLLTWWLSRPRRIGFRVRPRALLTENEREFHGRLCAAVPELTILVQVSMGALMEPDVAGATADYLAIRSRFAQKVVDFVLVDEDFNVVCLIELDDRTHDAAQDARRDAMTAAAGLPTLRFESRNRPTPVQLRHAVQALMQ